MNFLELTCFLALKSAMNDPDQKAHTNTVPLPTYLLNKRSRRWQAPAGLWWGILTPKERGETPKPLGRTW